MCCPGEVSLAVCFETAAQAHKAIRIIHADGKKLGVTHFCRVLHPPLAVHVRCREGERERCACSSDNSYMLCTMPCHLRDTDNVDGGTAVHADDMFACQGLAHIIIYTHAPKSS